MSTLPRVPKQVLRHLVEQEGVLYRACDHLLTCHGVTGPFAISGVQPEELENSFATLVRLLVRLHAEALLAALPMDGIGDPLRSRVKAAIETWLNGAWAYRAEPLRTLADDVVRDELQRISGGEPTQASTVKAARRIPAPDAEVPPPADANSAKRGRGRGKDRTTAPDDLLDAHEAAEVLGVEVQWVRDHTTRVKPIIPHSRIGRRTVRFERAELLRFIQEQREERPRWERPQPSGVGTK